jgi:hypothetical protein
MKAIIFCKDLWVNRGRGGVGFDDKRDNERM